MRLVRDLAIRSQLPVENTSDIITFEKCNYGFFPSDAHDDAKDGGLRKLTLQTMAANAYDASVLQQDGELSHGVIACPMIEEARDNLRADHLALVNGEIGWALGFVYIFPDQQAVGRRVFMVSHCLTSESTAAARSFAKRVDPK